MNNLTEEQVLHVANLARLNVNQEEITKYGIQLKDILTEINKINNVNITGDIMISSCDNHNMYKEDEVKKGITKEEMFSNAKNNDGEYIIVPKVLND